MFDTIKRSIRKGTLRRISHWLLKGHVARWMRMKVWMLQTKKLERSRILQIGGGRHTVDDALSADIIAGDVYINAEKRLPVPTNSVDYIITEHFLEHLKFTEARLFIEETKRILRPGGIARHSTPSLEWQIELYMGKCDPGLRDRVLERHRRHHRRSGTEMNPCIYLNDVFRRWGHEFVYDRPTLEMLHRQAGFSEIEFREYGESSHSELRGRERHAESEWMKEDFIHILEARC